MSTDERRGPDVVGLVIAVVATPLLIAAALLETSTVLRVVFTLLALAATVMLVLTVRDVVRSLNRRDGT